MKENKVSNQIIIIIILKYPLVLSKTKREIQKSWMNAFSELNF